MPRRTPQPGRPANAGPFTEDEVTEWLGTAVTPPPAVKPKPVVKSGPADRSEPAAMPPAAGRQRRRGQPVLLVALVLALAAASSLAVVVVRHLAGSPANSGVSPALLHEEAALRGQAAAWVAQQVSQAAIVSCDPVMCHALTARGYPSRNLLVLGSASPVPVKSAVVVETPAVLALFGSSLATAWAPAVLASFGSGPAEITVRVIAPHGAAAYQNALNADLAARKKSGEALLLNDNQVTIAITAQEQLASGQVESRLVLALAALAAHQPISILDFGNIGPGVDADLPLRFADLAENDQASHLGSAAYVRSMRSYLSTVAQYRPARTESVVTAGQTVLRVEFTAPSPLGLFGLQGLR